jgi:hypothetical protein
MFTGKVLVAAAGGALALAVVGAGGVYLAETGTHTTSAQTPAAQATATPNARGAQAQTRINDFLDQLAKNLNIDRPTLDNALKQTAKDEVAQAVSAGKLTQSEADQIDNAIDRGKLPQGLGFGIPGIAGVGRNVLGQISGLQTAIQNAFQQTVGESQQQFFQEIKGGMTPDQVFQEHNTSAQAVGQAEAAAAKPILDQAVSSGQITQDQENSFLTALQNHGGFGGFAGFAGSGDMGRGGHGRGPGNGNGAQPSASPGTTHNMQ